MRYEEVSHSTIERATTSIEQ